jgi:hypothetical protein
MKSTLQKIGFAALIGAALVLAACQKKKAETPAAAAAPAPSAPELTVRLLTDAT